MITLTTDSRAQQIVQSVLDALKDATLDGRPAFPSVQSVESVSAFEAIADPLPSMAAAVVPGQPQRALGTDNSEDHLSRLPMDILVKLYAPRAPGTGSGAAIAEMQNVAELIRQALLVDPWRGGLAHRIMWNGQFLDRTDVSGDAKLVPPKASQAFFVMTLPVACGWTVGNGG